MHEIKFDGYRLLAWKVDGKAHLITRGGHDWTDRFPALARAIEDLLPDGSCIDGEVCVFDKQMVSRFDSLQSWLKLRGNDEPTFMAFDLVAYEGNELTGVPLGERKALLKSIVQGDSQPAVVYSEHAVGNSNGITEEACRHGLEGIISKKIDSKYVQERSHSWIKTKCVQQEEFVVCGYTAPAGSRAGFGALLIGQYDENGVLQFVGKVGTGFDDRLLQSLLSDMMKRESPKNPFPSDSVTPKVKSWLKPDLVAQVRYATRTSSGMLRHAVFLGLREDKSAKDVHPEEPMRKLPITITHPERILFPEAGITKQGLAEYYDSIFDLMLPWLKDRPLAIVRCPDGIQASCFFQKHAGIGMPESVSKLAKGEEEPFLTIAKREDLLNLAQFGAIEFHAWASTFKNLEKPDMMVLDLDPGPGVSWKTVVQAAEVTAAYIRSLGLTPFVKLSGGKGIHVVIPIEPGSLDWKQFKEFSQALAKNLDEMVPGQFVTVSTKAKRNNRIYIDYLRNGRGSTAIVPFSARTTPEASVSVPLSWNDLSQIDEPRQFTIANSQNWLSKVKDDPWKDLFNSATNVTQAQMEEVGLK